MRASMQVFIGFLLSAAGAAALDVSDGPLLVFTHPEKSLNDPASFGGSSEERVNSLYLVDPHTSPTPHRIFPNSGNHKVLARPVRDKLLIYSHFDDRLHLLDLSHGLDHVLLRNRRTEFVACDGPLIYFFEVQTQTHDKDCFLCKVSATGSMIPRMLTDMAIERLVAVTEKDIWIATKEKELWRISKDGVDCRKIYDLPDKFAGVHLISKFSPDGKALAIANVPDHRYTDRPDFLVIDAVTGKTHHKKEGIVLGTIIEMNSGPALEFNWADNTHVDFMDVVPVKPNQKIFEDGSKDGYTQNIEIDITTGNCKATKLADEVWPSYGLNHSESIQWDKRKDVGLFAREDRKIFYAGEAQSLVDLDEERGTSPLEIEFSPDGEWASYYLKSNDRAERITGNCPYLIDGKTKTKHKLIEGWSYDMQWLPAMK